MVGDALPPSFQTMTQRKWLQFLQPHFECVINFCFLFPQSHVTGGTVGHVQMGDLVTGIGKTVILETGQDSCMGSQDFVILGPDLVLVLLHLDRQVRID